MPLWPISIAIRVPDCCPRRGGRMCTLADSAYTGFLHGASSIIISSSLYVSASMCVATYRRFAICSLSSQMMAQYPRLLPANVMAHVWHKGVDSYIYLIFLLFPIFPYQWLVVGGVGMPGFEHSLCRF